MVTHALLEVAKTVLEVAEVAWTAVECYFDLLQLRDHLLDAVNSERFLNELESHCEQTTCKFPFNEPSASTKALAGVNKVEKMVNIWQAGKMFYTLATWGLALASLYQGRAILRMATLGVHHTSKLAQEALYR